MARRSDMLSLPRVAAEFPEESSRTIQRVALTILVIVPLALGFFFGTPLLAALFGGPTTIGTVDSVAPRRPPVVPSTEPAPPAAPAVDASVRSTRPLSGIGAVQSAASFDFAVREMDLDVTDAAKLRVQLLVAMRNGGTGQQSYSPNYFSLVDGAGNVFTALPTAGEASLGRSALAVGESTEGWLAFDLPSGTENVLLIYYPLGAGARQTSLAVDLGF